MQADDQRLDPVIEQIYGAIGRPDVWNAVLGTLAGLMHGHRAIMYIQDVKANRLLFWATHDIPEKIFTLFESDHLSNPTNLAAMQVAVGGMFSARMPVISPEQTETLAVYREIMEPLNIYWGSGGVLLHDGEAFGLIFVFRPRDPGPFSDAEDDLLLGLIPHLCRAAQLHYRLLITELERATVTSVLDRLTQAVAICDGAARVLIANASAKRLLDAKRGLRSVEGYLAGASAAQSNDIVDRIRAVAEGERATASVILEDDDETFRVLISRISPELRLALNDQPHLVLVSFSDPAADLSTGVEVLKDLLKLTEAEARVALVLARGRTMDEIAIDLGVSLNTIRTHVARTFDKTGTNRQADLVRTVLRTLGPFGLE